MKEDANNAAAQTATALTAALTLEQRSYKLDDFDTVSTVGTGTFGRVFLVKEKKTRGYFALKAMKIPDVIRLKQEQHVQNEKAVLSEVNHPFLIRLFWTHHDECFLYMLMDYVPGGELFSYLRNMGRFNNSTGQFYSAEIVWTGTFGRVFLVKEKKTRGYFALKAMKIPDVIRLKQEQHVQNEKAVLSEVNHPFLIRLFWTHHDECFLYMLMDYVPGGELFSYLRNMGRFNNSTGLFYSAEIVCAIEYLHSKEIVYRDLKPENILLDRDGHIRLTDFGFAKKLVDRYPPFFDDNPFGIYQKILAGKIDFPRHLDFNVK
ncbi:UNVERIFIED_CONTAM: hypothetical protein FKN15_024447 [Acipenser sinensis]